MTYRAICSSCMKANEDESADRCPACNSRRLVIVSGDMEGRAEYRRRQKEREAAAARRRAARPAPASAAPEEPKFEPVPDPEPPAAREAAPASPVARVRAGRRGQANVQIGHSGGLRGPGGPRPILRGEALIASLGQIIYDHLSRRVGINEEIRISPDGSITAPLFAVMDLTS